MISRAAMLNFFKYPDFNKNYDTCKEKGNYGPYTGIKNNRNCH